jgi:hypothetical protein
MTHTAHKTAHKPALHVRHASKIAKVGKRSRLWCEIVTCAGTAYETHLIILTIISIAWVIVDVAMILIHAEEEL